VRILIIETSTSVCSVSIVNREEILVCKETNIANSHSGQLAVMIKDSLDQIKLTTKELSAVAVSSGPGSYTGLRVGSSTAKGICYASNLPFIALDTLKGLSYAPKELKKDANNYIFSLIDARRDEVYAAVYDPNHHVLLPGAPVVLDDSSFKRFRQNNALWHLCGNGASKAKRLLNFEDSKISTELCSSKYFHKMAVNAFLNEAFEDIAYFTPNYFKPPNITKSNKTLI